MRSLLFKLPGTATRLTASKFFRDSSSFQVTLPWDKGCKRNGVPLAWHAMHRAWPGRLARKMGCTLVLKNSKSSDPDAVEGEPCSLGSNPSAADVEPGCWLSNPTSIKVQHAITVCMRPPECLRVSAPSPGLFARMGGVGVPLIIAPVEGLSITSLVKHHFTSLHANACFAYA